MALYVNDLGDVSHIVEMCKFQHFEIIDYLSDI